MSASSWSRFRQFLGKSQDQVTLEHALDQREAAEKALLLSERQFRILVERVTDYAIYMLDAGGRISTWNRRAERIKGYTAREIVRQHFARFFTKNDRWEELPQRALETAAHEGKYISEGWRVRKDGSQFWANIVIQATRDEDGELIGFAKITQDVTERLKQQDVLAKAQPAFYQVQNMEAIGQLSGAIAHDSNNRLTSIISSLDLLERLGEITADEPRQLIDVAKTFSYTRRITDAAAACFSGKQALDPRPLDVNCLVRKMSELLRPTLRESIEIETVLAGGLWQTFVNPNQLEHALLNLAINARDAMPDGGKLTIETGNTYLDDNYAATRVEVTSTNVDLTAALNGT
jgi:PAS domain S-box-containing protein